ncbi:MAG TPA: hypothetical protein VFQ22_01175 [Longimicrobiales bacterium]|nr:hypothetical protein [Longimicrobiales bacterium]
MRRTSLALLLAAAALAACQEPVDPALPTAEEVGSYYTTEAELQAELSGNVAVITVVQPASQLRRGGSLWARVGPYVYLFSEETRRLLDDYPGLAAVRVRTRTAGGEEIAEAQLLRDELSSILWRRALNISGLARRDGTTRPALLEDLIRWGEEHTEHAYNPAYTDNHGR